MKIVCQSCRYERNYSVIEMIKLVKDSTCQQCGANLFEGRDEQPGDAGLEEYTEADLDVFDDAKAQVDLVECPRCREKQEPAPVCKWCVAPMGVKARLKKPLSILTRTGAEPSRVTKGLLFKVLAGIFFVYLLFVGGSYYFLKDSDVFRASRDFMKKSEPVRSVVGEEIKAGPFPLVFSHKSSRRRSYFYFFVAGDKGHGVVYLRLRKISGRWKVARGTLWDSNLKSYSLTPGKPGEEKRAKARVGSKYPGKDKRALNQLRDAQRYYNQRDYNKAVAKYTEAIETDPNNADAYYRRGMAWVRVNKKDKAIEDLKKAVSLSPDRTGYYYYLSWLYMSTQQHDQGIILLTELMRRKPKEANAYFYRSRGFHHKREYQDALDDINTAIELEPGNAKFYYWRGTTYKQMKVMNRAEKDYKTAIGLNPKYPSPYFGLAYLLELRKRYKESIAVLTKLIEVASREKRAYYRNQAYFSRGNMYRKNRDLTAAARDFADACTGGHRGACREATRIREKG